MKFRVAAIRGLRLIVLVVLDTACGVAVIVLAVAGLAAVTAGRTGAALGSAAVIAAIGAITLAASSMSERSRSTRGEPRWSLPWTASLTSRR